MGEALMARVTGSLGEVILRGENKHQPCWVFEVPLDGICLIFHFLSLSYLSLKISDK